jgi:hypothetical protein
MSARTPSTSSVIPVSTPPWGGSETLQRRAQAGKRATNQRPGHTPDPPFGGLEGLSVAPSSPSVPRSGGMEGRGRPGLEPPSYPGSIRTCG